MRHLDLFSGIGGFAYAAREVWKDDYETVAFCDIDKFCQAVLRLRFPGVPIYGDIFELNKLIADSDRDGLCGHTESEEVQSERRTETTIVSDSQDDRDASDSAGERPVQCEHEGEPRHQEGIPSGHQWVGIDLLTGGFPCQPFSHAGKRRGRDDERHLWPAMLETIRLTRPRWVIAENVRGLLSIEQGVAFEQVCLDLEALGYEVRAFLIPACAVDAPHRRDRVWIVAHTTGERLGGGSEDCSTKQPGLYRKGVQADGDAPDGVFPRLEGRQQLGYGGGEVADAESGWEQDWPSVAARLCGVDDGLPAKVDGLELPKSRHRIERLKSLGNSIVPQVAMEIMRAIKEADGK